MIRKSCKVAPVTLDSSGDCYSFFKKEKKKGENRRKVVIIKGVRAEGGERDERATSI